MDYEHEDYRPLPPSPRHQLALELSLWMAQKGLQTAPEMGEVHRDPRGRCYEVRFAMSAPTEGVVLVFGLDYLRVRYRTDRPGLPDEDSRLFDCAEAVMVFLEAAFIDGDTETALALPQRQPKRPRKDQATQEAP